MLTLGKKQIAMAAGTFACALSIGMIMQSTGSAQRIYGKPPAVAEDPMLTVQDITLTAAEYEQAPDVDLMKDLPASGDADIDQLLNVSATAVDTTIQDPEHAEVLPACDIVAEATTQAAAMVRLKLDAPCMPSERVTVHHNGMIITETTKEDGSLELTLPALAQKAVFIVAFNTGEGAVAQTEVENLESFERSVLQWKGNTGFQIHAREFGADYGSEHHIWEEQPADLATVVTGRGGMMTRHGDASAPDPLLAEVYTFPLGSATRSGDVAISVETEVTIANCGLEVEAQSLELYEGGEIKTQNLLLPVPDCDAQGSFLVLNNLLRDLKVAAK